MDSSLSPLIIELTQTASGFGLYSRSLPFSGYPSWKGD